MRATTTTVKTTGDPAVEVSVRQTEELSAVGKGHPEETVVAYVERAFDRIDLPARLVWDLRPVGGVPDPKTDKRAAFRHWAGQVKRGQMPGLAADANLLLTTLEGGGMAQVGGSTALCPAGALLEHYATDLVEWVPKSDPRHPVFGVLHELAHCLGSSHLDNWGRTWIDHAERAWYRTPTAHPDTTSRQGARHERGPAGYERRDWLSFAVDAGPFVRPRERGAGRREQDARTAAGVSFRRPARSG